jgi:macrolide-specific efflux system membrane fusion protein
MIPVPLVAGCLLLATPVTPLDRAPEPVITSASPSYASATRSADFPLVPSLPGIANPRRRVTLTAPVEGPLFAIQCQEGQRVERGAVLAVIDNRVAAAATKLAASEAAQTGGIARAQAELDAANKLLARMTRAGERHAASELEVERAQNAVEQAEAMVDQAREQRDAAQVALALEQAKLDAYNIRAPFDGQVVRIRSEVGETLTLVKPVLELVDNSRLRVELYLPMDCYARLETGATYQLLASAPVNAALDATLVLKDHDIDPGTQTFRCVFEIDNADESLPSGFTVRLIKH